MPDDQLSLAIGNRGQNAKLAAKLTGFKIDIRPESGIMDTDKTPEQLEEEARIKLEQEEAKRLAIIEAKELQETQRQEKQANKIVKEQPSTSVKVDIDELLDELLQ